MIQLSFLPDNDQTPAGKRAAVPVARLINGRWCWLKFGTTDYQHEPELERILLAALKRHERKKAA